MMTLPEFRRNLFDPDLRFTRIGAGEIGGKAQSLVHIKDVLADINSHQFELTIPSFTVLTTELYDLFLQRNSLKHFANSDTPDEVIAHEFQKSQFPAEYIGDLRGLIEKVAVPLAIRSSSLLEDSLHQPFAGIYLTKMIPNNQPSPDERFRKLIEAIKLVYASVFFQSAKDYMRAADLKIENEKMGVIVQEIVGERHQDRFYPPISGVARSYNHYAIGKSRSEDGVVNLALGLGKTIVDGGKSWAYSPAFPKAAPPTSLNELLDHTQTSFWAVNMGKPPAYDPVKETEYMNLLDISKAEEDDVLNLLASTYDAQSDRLTPGIGRKGPRVLNFAGILQTKNLPINDLILSLLKVCADVEGAPVEIEFAVTLNPLRFGFLQLRPTMTRSDEIEIAEEDWNSPDLLLKSENVLGNGRNDSIKDIVYVDPEKFDQKNSRRIEQEVEQFNRELLSENRPYLLIGFGRWGSADPWLGIPVNWGEVSGAKVIVEAATNADLSQGSHFFHNLISFGVAYFSVRDGIRWDWIKRQSHRSRLEFVYHVRLDHPLTILVDGKRKRGMISWHLGG